MLTFFSIAQAKGLTHIATPVSPSAALEELGELILGPTRDVFLWTKVSDVLFLSAQATFFE